MIDREVGLAVAATATALSPRAREVVRKGAVYGLAGVMKAGDVVASTAKGAARGAQEGAGSNGGDPAAAQAGTAPVPATESRPAARGGKRGQVGGAAGA